MADIPAWIAPLATMVAAVMTAANLGARVTGWGFVVFTLGSVCWSIVGVATSQTNLLVTNVVLTLINIVGIWRWLGRQRGYEDGGKSAQNASRNPGTPTLFTATGIFGMPVVDQAGIAVGKAVEALLECGSGVVSYIVIASGGPAGIDEVLRAVPRDAVKFDCERMTLQMNHQAYWDIPTLADGDWPAEPER